jgi:hypothetical protein
MSLREAQALVREAERAADSVYVGIAENYKGAIDILVQGWKEQRDGDAAIAHRYPGTDLGARHQARAELAAEFIEEAEALFRIAQSVTHHEVLEARASRRKR